MATREKRKLAGPRTCFAFLCGMLLGCSSSPQTDGGTDAGRADSGTPMGRDAGRNLDDQCEFDSMPCASGSCTLAVLEDAGIAKRCLAGACDLVLQDCDAGMKCAYADGGRACVPDGTLDEGAPCSETLATCKRGLVCTLIASDGGSACSRFCRLDRDCAAPQECYTTLQLDGTNERPLVCAPPPLTCDPLLQNCPDLADGCFPGSMPGCFPAGNVPNGDVCMFSNDCTVGSVCVGASPSTCRQICGYPSGAPTCAAGHCTLLQGYTNVGACL